MKICIIIAWLGNIIDIASTLYLCGNGYAVEANPVMALFLQCPFAFAAVKIGVMTGVVLWLWHSRGSRYARITAAAGAIIYGWIAVYYMVLFGLL